MPVVDVLGCGIDDVVYGCNKSSLPDPDEVKVVFEQKVVEKVVEVPVEVEKIVKIVTETTCTLSDVTNYGEYCGYPIRDVFGRYCSNCHYEVPDIMVYHYCPNCGAQVLGYEE